MELFAKQCTCGAVTVLSSNNDDNYDVSMTLEDFKKHFPDMTLEEGKFCNCNYCVNHWGIDLCNCGSGEKVGKCTNGLHDCRNNIPAQYLDKPKTYTLWR
jgi:hypothetical protein